MQINHHGKNQDEMFGLSPQEVEGLKTAAQMMQEAYYRGDINEGQFTDHMYQLGKTEAQKAFLLQLSGVVIGIHLYRKGEQVMNTVKELANSIFSTIKKEEEKIQQLRTISEN